jgi:hypothetical protein
VGRMTVAPADPDLHFPAAAAGKLPAWRWNLGRNDPIPILFQSAGSF